MDKGYFIIGTDTGVGKTIVTAGLVGVLREKGIDAIPYKPVQSGAVPNGNGLQALDVEFYKQVCDLPPGKYNTYALEPPLAPSLAAELSQVSIGLDKIKEDFLSLTSKHQMVIVEGAGGLFVPLKDTNFLLPDLIKELNLPIIIVARPNLGTINHTIMTIKCAEQLGLQIKGVIYNGYEENCGLSEKYNPGIISEITKIPVLGKIPKGKNIDVDARLPGNTLDLVRNNVNFQLLTTLL